MYHHYPLPGQPNSKYHRNQGNDKARALARPYVGMNMNHMRRHIATGHGDGRAASNWIGSLRSKAKGADGGYRQYAERMEEQKGKEESGSQERLFARTTMEEEGAGGESHKESNSSSQRDIDMDTKVQSKRTEMVQPRRQKITRRRAGGKGARGETKYVGNKTQAQMDGVPVSMRWEKPNVHGNTTRGYLRMKEKLYRGSINEMFQKFSLSGRGRRSDTGATTAVAWTNSSNNAKNVKEEAIEKRRRRMQYGDRMAVRFKKKKRTGQWVD